MKLKNLPVTPRNPIDELVAFVLSEAEEEALLTGLHVVDVRSRQQGNRMTIEVTIFNRQASLGLTDCEKFSRKLEARLEKSTLPMLQRAFLLEVQSPGIDRELHTTRELSVFAGQCVDIKLRSKFDDLGTDFTGILNGLKEGKVRIDKPRRQIIEETTKGRRTQASKKASYASPQAGALTTEAVEIELDEILKIRLHPLSPPSETPVLELD